MPGRRRVVADRAIAQDAIKTLVANIRFASVDSPVRTIAVTSSIPNEGKTTISVSLARALASGGKDVLIVECDTRHRCLSSVLGVHPQGGLYAVLAGQAGLEEVAIPTQTRGLGFLDCEPRIPNPADLFASRRFRQLAHQLRREYDYVIFDTPPLSAFVDGAIVGSVVDATLLVVRENFVRRDALVAAHEQLRKASAHVIGTVLNCCEREKSEYYYSYYAKGEGSVQRRDHANELQGEASDAPADGPVVAPRVVPVRPPAAGHVPPSSTAQFLAGTQYVARDLEDE